MSAKFQIDPLEHTTAIDNVSNDLLIRFIMPWISSIVLLITISFSACVNSTHNLKFESMLVEYAESPINIDMIHPRFSWIVSTEGRNRKQTAFRIYVSSSLSNLRDGKFDLWDSGRIESEETIQHEYIPENLSSNSQYYWKVIIWDEKGRKYESKPAQFETAFLNDSDWSAGWIGSQPSPELVPPNGFYKDPGEQVKTSDTVNHDGSSLLLRYETEIVKKIASAKVFITGVGYYEFFINGTRVGDHLLAPAKTPYHKYILYDSYDISAILRQGRNAFGIHLGNGWYNPYKKWWNMYRMQWFGSKKAIAQIHIKYTDGTTRVINTDSNWLYSPGPVKYNCVYDGEVYDANSCQDGWAEPGFDDSSWKKVSVFSHYKPRLASHRMPAIKAMETFIPREVKTVNKGRRVFDMGQNFAGSVSLNAHGKKGNVLKIRFAEDLKPDSTLDITSNENANATAVYTMKGQEIETYEPRFAFFGFRYIEITSENGDPDIIEVKGKALYSDNHLTGQFECSNMLVNKIHDATVRSQKSNMLGYPMDCPQRDERLGWLGDAQVTAEEAMFNFNMALFYENWLEGIKENQDAKSGDIPIISPRPYIKDDGIEWSSTYIVMLWQFYTFYGDKHILSHHYSAMKKYMNFLDSISNDMILPMGWIGDWGSMVKGWKEGEPASVPTAFYFQNAMIMSDIAGILEKHEDSEYFRSLATAIREKYNKIYLDTLSANYNDGSQMANAFPLYLGIVPENLKSRVLDNLVDDIVVNQDNHLTTGVLGTKYMPEALAASGRADVAWKIINQKTAPCWNDMMKRYSTMCEFWTLKQSKNHVMMGSIDAWFYKYLAGIRPSPADPAFSSFIIKPVVPDSLYSAGATILTLRGKISSFWRIDNGVLSLDVEVPFNTTAEVFVPGDPDGKLMESGKPLAQCPGIEYPGYSEMYHKVKVSSGKYSFTIIRK